MLFRLADIIEKEIVEVRTQYIPEDKQVEYSVPLLNSYIKLNTGQIISIPNCDDDYLHEIPPENQEHLQRIFANSNPISAEDREIIVGQTIVDILFCYEADHEPAYEYQAYLKLSNGYYITERNYEWVAFRLLDEPRFLAEKADLARRLQIDIRPTTRQG